MAKRLRIAAAVCLAAGMILSGAGAALALADPESAHGDDASATPSDPTEGGGATPAERSAVAETPARSTVKSATPSVASTAKPTSPARDDDGTHPHETPARLEPRPTAPPPRAIPPSVAPPSDTDTPTTTPGVGPPPTQPTAGDPKDDPGWPWWASWWHWCWPTPPGPGLPPGVGSGTGSGGRGGASIGSPPRDVGVPRAPSLPVVPADPAADTVGGSFGVAGGLPLEPIALPAVVPPLGVGAGPGGPGIAPGPAAPRPVGGTPGSSPPTRIQDPRVREQSPPAFGAGNGALPAAYRAGYGQYLRTAGVGEMAAVAVPGVTGIVALTLAGGVVGFRQARAGHALRANGAARFMG